METAFFFSGGVSGTWIMQPFVQEELGRRHDSRIGHPVLGLSENGCKMDVRWTSISGPPPNIHFTSILQNGG